MTVNKFCPVAQGEYYNNKSQAQSQLFFPFFSKFFLLCVQYLHFVITNSYKYKMLFWMLRRRIVHPFLVQIVLRTAMPRYSKNSWVSVVSYSFFTVLTLYFYIRNSTTHFRKEVPP